jgi:enamine deaminase RidA (YjgF/YER057c/UK114 family)
MRGWLATVPAYEANVTPRDDHGKSGGDAHRASSRSRESPHGFGQLSQSRTTSQQPGLSQAVRIPAGHDLSVIGGQNGVDSSGRVVSGDLAGQARQALVNLQACLMEAWPTLIISFNGRS